MPEMGEQPLPPYNQRVSTDPALAYTADPDEELKLKLWEESEDDAEYRRLLHQHGLAEIGYYILRDPYPAAASRPDPPEEQAPVVHP